MRVKKRGEPTQMTDSESGEETSSSSPPPGDDIEQTWPKLDRSDPVVCAIDLGVENPAYWIGRFDSAKRDFEYLAADTMPLPNPRKDKKTTRHESEKGLIDILLREPALERVNVFDLELQDPVATVRAAGPHGAQKTLAKNVVAYGQSRALAGALHVRFRALPEYLRPQIVFTHPSEKFRGFGLPKPKNYGARKRKAEAMEANYFARRSLAGTHREWHKLYASHAKKDDLADAAMAGKHRLRRLAHRRGKSAADRRRERDILAAALGSESKADALLTAHHGPPPPPPPETKQKKKTAPKKKRRRRETDDDDSEEEQESSAQDT
jgi:hypothetical protein